MRGSSANLQKPKKCAKYKLRTFLTQRRITKTRQKVLDKLFGLRDTLYSAFKDNL